MIEFLGVFWKLCRIITENVQNIEMRTVSKLRTFGHSLGSPLAIISYRSAYVLTATTPTEERGRAPPWSYKLQTTWVVRPQSYRDVQDYELLLQTLE